MKLDVRPARLREAVVCAITLIAVWGQGNMTRSAHAQDPLITTATASSQALAELGPGNAIDGDDGTFWSSAVHGDAAHIEVLRIDFARNIHLAGLTLTPRAGGHGFPEDYAVEYSYDADGGAWFPVEGAWYLGEPQATEPVTKTFSGTILARRLRVIATKLSTDDFGNYYFQLAEIAPVEGDAVFPFATSRGAAFDAQLNMLWTVFGSISDGTDAVFTFGSEPAWMEWLGIRSHWSNTTPGFTNTAATLLTQWAQSADGYIWSWGNQEKWPTGAGSFHQENNAKYILGCWRYWAWTRDDVFFDRVDPTVVSAPAAPSRPDVSQGKTIRQKLRDAMQYLLVDQLGNQGGIVVQDNGMDNDGTVDGEPTNYWDNWRFGYKNPYDNIYYYAALEAMAQMETFWGDRVRAAELRDYREGCRADYLAQFYDPATGRYVSTIDKDGVTWDFGSTFVNLEALAYGLGDAEKAASIFDWLDGRRVVSGETATGGDIYAWRFAPRANTLAIETVGPPYWWFSIGGAIRVDTSSARWDNHLENGGAIFYTSFYDLLARLRWRGPDDAAVRLQAIVDEFAIDQLRRDPTAPGSAPWQLGIIGEFPESGLVPCFIPYGFAGLSAELPGLRVFPRLPSDWSFLTVREVRFAGTLLTITVRHESVEVVSDVASARTLYVETDPIAPGQDRTFAVEPGEPIWLRLEPLNAARQWERLADRP